MWRGKSLTAAFGIKDSLLRGVALWRAQHKTGVYILGDERWRPCVNMTTASHGETAWGISSCEFDKGLAFKDGYCV